MKVKALLDYDANAPGELDIRKDEMLEVVNPKELSSETGWVLVETFTYPKSKGYVPSGYVSSPLSDENPSYTSPKKSYLSPTKSERSLRSRTSPVRFSPSKRLDSSPNKALVSSNRVYNSSLPITTYGTVSASDKETQILIEQSNQAFEGLKHQQTEQLREAVLCLQSSESTKQELLKVSENILNQCSLVQSEVESKIQRYENMYSEANLELQQEFQ
eukprot:maker-scaffold_20-snap-gene-5.1-mRNA-1 protein AED:0.00 eAED:0.00 QI:9/1/1/1/0.5/0.66/3/28/216